MAEFYKLTFYVPAGGLEAVKEAVFSAGGGRLGCYDKCCWQVKGEGQFRPLEGSNPYVGAVDQVERIEEYRVEMLCAAECMESVEAALLKAHPYETPAYDFSRVVLCTFSKG